MSQRPDDEMPREELAFDAIHALARIGTKAYKYGDESMVFTVFRVIKQVTIWGQDR